ncbi:MAG: hypothetical protein PHS99_09125 [Candidatus Marinimicrobia bacterium]|nr:hypothetical protein [Candidatus Neomarinimicrobiota bacterium]
MIRKIIEFDLKYPRTIIAFCILLTLLMGWNIPKIKLEPDIKALMPQDFEIIENMKDMEDTFGGNDLVVVSITADNIFSPATLEKIEAITSEIEILENVDQVISITNVPDIVGTADGFEVRELIEEFPTTESEIDSLKKRIIGNRMIYGTLVSSDFQKAGIIAYLKVATDENSDEQVYQIFNAIKNKYAGPEQIHIAEMLPVLKKAGMVDSGAMGFLVLIKGVATGLEYTGTRIRPIMNIAIILSTSRYIRSIIKERKYES